MRKVIDIFFESPCSFEGQEENEKLIMIMRHHPFNIFVRISTAMTGAILPILIGLVFWPVFVEFGIVAVFFFALSLWYMSLWLGIFYALTMYSLDIMIITDHRVIDQDQLGLFDRHVATLHVSRIQDVSTHVQGLIPTYFKYGDVIVQTASAEQRFSFPRVPHPDKVKEAILKVMREHNGGIRRV